MLILLTGLRREEAASLSWSAIDFKAKTFTITEIKNNTAHTMPLSDYLFDLLKRRKACAVNNYVFPATSATGYINAPAKHWRKLRKFLAWNLLSMNRRTFITIAESLDIPVYALKRLLNHKISSDVTAGYVVIDIERLHAPMQLITDYILRLMGIKESANIVSIKAKPKV